LALSYPAVQDGISLITFAEAADLDERLGPEVYIAQASEPLEVAPLLEKTNLGKHLFQLLRLAWEHMLAERQLPVYELANKARCFYFPRDRVPNDKAFFIGLEGTRTYRGEDRLQHPDKPDDRRERKAVLALCDTGKAARPSHSCFCFQATRSFHERWRNPVGEQETTSIGQAQSMQNLAE